jgi:hypothetical protein
MDSAAECGHLHICQYLHAEQCPWGTEACADAAFGGHLSTLRWLHEQGCPWGLQSVRSTAAFGGHLEVMGYLLSVAPPATAAQLTELLNKAGATDKLAVAQWLRQQGAEWPAVLRYHCYTWMPWKGDTLMWARQQGCTSPAGDDDESASDSDSSSDSGSDAD